MNATATGTGTLQFYDSASFVQTSPGSSQSIRSKLDFILGNSTTSLSIGQAITAVVRVVLDLALILVLVRALKQHSKGTVALLDPVIPCR